MNENDVVMMEVFIGLRSELYFRLMSANVSQYSRNMDHLIWGEAEQTQNICPIISSTCIQPLRIVVSSSFILKKCFRNLQRLASIPVSLRSFYIVIQLFFALSKSESIPWKLGVRCFIPSCDKFLMGVLFNEVRDPGYSKVLTTTNSSMLETGSILCQSILNSDDLFRIVSCFVISWIYCSHPNIGQTRIFIFQRSTLLRL